MISYNPKEWFTFLFRFHKSDTLRKLFPLMIGVSVYAALITYLMIDYFHVADKNVVHKISLVHTTLGFVLSLLLAFRINSAYDRWWEGRKLWGSLVNNSRNLAIKIKHVCSDEDIAFYNEAIPLYAEVLKNHLRGIQMHHT
jgi:putative membrane protein